MGRKQAGRRGADRFHHSASKRNSNIMNITALTQRTWLTLLLSIVIVILSSFFRVVFFSELGRGIPYLTYYPAVMIAAIIGGLPAGLLATLISAFLTYSWIQQGQMSTVEWLAMAFFVLICIMISVLANAMHRSRKKAEHAKTEAEAANQAKSVFLANMSHELRTPLNAIIGFGKILASSKDLSAENRDKVDIIRRSGDHLLNMIDEILSLARIEAGRIELGHESFNLLSNLEDIAQMFTIRAQDKGLRFDVELDVALQLTVQGDVGKIRQVLINLLGNAIKFTNQGHIRLRAHTEAIKDNPGYTLLHLEVGDSGPGIPQEQIDNIFESFVQGSQAQSGDVKGAGLGLAICKSLVDLMQGRISVTSEIRKGSVFTVTIPIELADLSAIMPESVSDKQVIGLKSGNKDWRILIVDDNADNRALLTTIIGQVGFKTQEADNGETAVKKFREWNPHLICMDMRMQVMDGYVATKVIRELPGGTKVKILAVTASVFQEQRDKILSAGCDELVRKPIQEHYIFTAIKQQLGVEYRYEQIKKIPIAETSNELTQEMLADLPAEFLDDLRQAILALDREAMAVLIKRLEPEAKSTAQGLKTLVESYQFGRIRELLGDSV